MFGRQGDWEMGAVSLSRNNSQKSSITFDSILLTLKPSNSYTLLRANPDLVCSSSLAKRGQPVAEEKAHVTKTSLLLQNMHPRTFTSALRAITINN